MRTISKTVNLTDKLSILVMFAVLSALIVLGVYFDTFLKESYLESTKKRMLHGYQRLAYNLDNIESELMEGIAFIKTDEGMLASIDLVNNYQDKDDYNAVLLDEEKQHIASQLLDRVKLSFNDDIMLYDRNGELIASVTKEPRGYLLQFVSYEGGEPLLYSRYENEAFYRRSRYAPHARVPFKHTAYYTDAELLHGSKITYHAPGKMLIIKSHDTIFEEKTGRPLAHIELSQILDKAYFKTLSLDLDLQISCTSKQRHWDKAPPPLESTGTQRLSIEQTDDAYIGTAYIPTLNGPVYFLASLNKSMLKRVLDANRWQFLGLLALTALVIVLPMRYLLHRGLERPLGALMGQISKIEHRDYSTSRVVKTGDELEAISSNINHLALTVQERETSLQQSQSRLEYLSNHDALTELPNRRYFLQGLRHALALAERNGSQLAVLFLDLDQFKVINDTLGHDVGDELLREVSKRLLRHMRSADTLARIGGDEFNILVENIAGVVEIETFVQKLLEVFDASFSCGGYEISTAASVGIALYPADGTDSVTLIKHADLAMYKAKETRRNSYRFFSQELSARLKERAEKIRALESALEGFTEFALFYQPKVSAASGKIVGVEALIRWKSLLYGFLRPDQFITLAEETNLIIPIGQWVLQQACRDFVMLLEEGYALEHLSINISGVQLLHSDVAATLEETIETTGIRPDQLELEITESYLATDAEEALQTMQRLREMGVSLAIDDFGTGYSSLSYLQHLPVTRIKIDKTFVGGLPYSQENRAIVNAVLALAKSFGLSVTAEGVESEEQFVFLKEAKCDEIQGYFCAMPMALNDFKAFYRETDAKGEHNCPPQT
jgi:diguanylate cyclase (GGDEF)-like protein